MAESYAGSTFSGTSNKGNFQDALDEAIKAALASTKVSDAQAKWTLHQVTGIQGGITGQNTLTVTIEAIVP